MLKKRLLAGFLAVITAITIIGVNVSSTYGSIGTKVRIYSNSSTKVQQIAQGFDDIGRLLSDWDNFSRAFSNVADNLEKAYDAWDKGSDVWENHIVPAFEYAKEKWESINDWIADIKNNREPRRRESEIRQVINSREFEDLQEVINSREFEDLQEALYKARVRANLIELFNRLTE